jgi:NDP-sugar pyrophosphorylase family protein
MKTVIPASSLASHRFEERPQANGIGINGCFLRMEPNAFNLIGGDPTVLEPLECLVRRRKLLAYKPRSFWSAINTPSDKNIGTSCAN